LTHNQRRSKRKTEFLFGEKIGFAQQGAKVEQETIVTHDLRHEDQQTQKENLSPAQLKRTDKLLRKLEKMQPQIKVTRRQKITGIKTEISPDKIQKFSKRNNQ